MARSLTIKNLYDKKFKTFDFKGVWQDTMGKPEVNGAWIVYGAEKNGKTWFSLKLAEYLSGFGKTMYVSAEEGTGMTFVDACRRAKIDLNNNMLHFQEYIPIEELDKKLSNRKAAKIVFLDNVTIYADELKNGVLRKFLQKHSDKLIVFIAHEERKEPYTATAKLARKLAKIIVRVQGLACFVSGRCNGGILMIDEQKAALYHGTEITTT
ncbi:hypothetical protein [Tenacibaculum maritimum]|uniref:hypothetical protein n=1 Tax=Tenacibaculum maritimum TaxID=107401 RepID=UPI002306E22E|nr:hypothetical protein [Tenacibaculum maritimum]MDB0601108.1 hypothetical protein [Tenacibaculum maritimum]MDB0612190.1 hypothetical protein [Tenacibaculum maritimum]